MINSGRSLQTMGLGCLRFMLRGGSLPRVSRSIAPSVIAPPSGRRTLFKTRRLSLGLTSLRRVGIGNPDAVAARPIITGGGLNLSLALRNEPGSQALREVSKRRPCVCSLHEGEHGGTDVPFQRIPFPIQEKNDERRR